MGVLSKLFNCFRSAPDTPRHAQQTDKRLEGHRRVNGLEQLVEPDPKGADPLHHPSVNKRRGAYAADVDHWQASSSSTTTVTVVPGASDISTCNSVVGSNDAHVPPKENIPAGFWSSGDGSFPAISEEPPSWPHVEELANEVAELRKRLAREEEAANKLREEVDRLRASSTSAAFDSAPFSPGQDSLPAQHRPEDPSCEAELVIIQEDDLAAEVSSPSTSPSSPGPPRPLPPSKLGPTQRTSTPNAQVQIPERLVVLGAVPKKVNKPPVKKQTTPLVEATWKEQAKGPVIEQGKGPVIEQAKGPVIERNAKLGADKSKQQEESRDEETLEERLARIRKGRLRLTPPPVAPHHRRQGSNSSASLGQWLPEGNSPVSTSPPTVFSTKPQSIFPGGFTFPVQEEGATSSDWSAAETSPGSSEKNGSIWQEVSLNSSLEVTQPSPPEGSLEPLAPPPAVLGAAWTSRGVVTPPPKRETNFLEPKTAEAKKETWANKAPLSAPPKSCPPPVGTGTRRALWAAAIAREGASASRNLFREESMPAQHFNAPAQHFNPPAQHFNMPAQQFSALIAGSPSNSPGLKKAPPREGAEGYPSTPAEDWKVPSGKAFLPPGRHCTKENDNPFPLGREQIGGGHPAQPGSAVGSVERAPGGEMRTNVTPDARAAEQAARQAALEATLARRRDVAMSRFDGRGIPNSTKKYSEDQKVKFHTTPFEIRLERTLARGSTDLQRTLF